MKKIDIIIGLCIVFICGLIIGILFNNMYFYSIHQSKFYLYDKEYLIDLDSRNGYFHTNYFIVKTVDASVVRKIPNVERTTLHEFAHYLQLFYFKDNEEWIKTFNQSSEFVSDYAKTNHKEDFAESFRYVMTLCYNEEMFNDLQKEKSDLLKPFIKKYWGECNGS